MILVDANLLVYAYHSALPEHAASRRWLDDQLATGTPVALPWESLNAFVRLVSNPRIFSAPSDLADAWAQVKRWLAEANVWVPVATPQHAAIAAELYRTNGLSAVDVPDVHLAALAISHGVRLATHDHGFSRFEGLRWFDPLT